VAISQADRKLLWGRAHNRCALCRRPLTADAESPLLAGLILGEEAHIIARAADGPRGVVEERRDIDGYANLILLCPEDHKRVDDQPDVYTVQALRTAKAEHERWAEERIDGVPGFEPIKVHKGADEDSIPFDPITTGSQAWNIVSGVQMYNLMPLDDAHAEDRVDAADAFLEAAKDWGEISAELDSLSQIREVQRSLKSLLEDLWAKDLFAWGRRLTRTVSGGVMPPSRWTVAELIVMAAEDVLAGGDAEEDAPAEDTTAH
jgi:hypothetical protein